MTELESIERAVEQLPAPELAAFRDWFTRFDEAMWDAQIEADVAAGKLDALAAEALEEYRIPRVCSGSGSVVMQSTIN